MLLWSSRVCGMCVRHGPLHCMHIMLLPCSRFLLCAGEDLEAFAGAGLYDSVPFPGELAWWYVQHPQNGPAAMAQVGWPDGLHMMGRAAMGLVDALAGRRHILLARSHLAPPGC